jgi:hypothetical protein
MSTDQDGGGLEITSIDHGPGISNLPRALVDGYSTAGSLGGGLGAVRRLTDECNVYSAPGKGTAIAARIRLKDAKAGNRLLLGGVAVPARGERVCGDTWLAWSDVHGLTIAMADGLGHGPDAALASIRAVEIMSQAAGLSGIEALQQAHAALHPTRGAAGAIATIDARAGLVRFAGLGNIGLVLSEPASSRHGVSMAGTLGHEARTFREFSYPWRSGTVAIMYSDGLSSHWSLDDYPGLRACSPSIIAAVLYRDFTRGRDDCTVVVAKEAA